MNSIEITGLGENFVIPRVPLIDIDSSHLIKWGWDATLEMVGIAQLVEQRTENPRVTSSNLVPDTWFNFYFEILIL